MKAFEIKTSTTGDMFIKIDDATWGSQIVNLSPDEARKLLEQLKQELNDTPSLLPCPFCGCEAHILRNGTHHGATISTTWFVECMSPECNVSGRIYHSEEYAVKQWNKRTKG